GDARGRGAAQGIDNKHHFHQVFVGGRAGGLNNKNIVAAHVLADFYIDLTIRKLRYSGATDGDTEVSGNFLSQLRVCVTGENHQISHGVSSWVFAETGKVGWGGRTRTSE